MAARRRWRHRWRWRHAVAAARVAAAVRQDHRRAARGERRAQPAWRTPIEAGLDTGARTGHRSGGQRARQARSTRTRTDPPPRGSREAPTLEAWAPTPTRRWTPRHPSLSSRPSFPEVSATRALLRGFRKRCPRCGERDTFVSWFEPRKACPRCELRFAKEEGGFLGAMSLNYVVAIGLWLVVLGVGVAMTVPDVPVVHAPGVERRGADRRAALVLPEVEDDLGRGGVPRPPERTRVPAARRTRSSPTRAGVGLRRQVHHGSRDPDDVSIGERQEEPRDGDRHTDDRLRRPLRAMNTRGAARRFGPRTQPRAVPARFRTGRQAPAPRRARRGRPPPPRAIARSSARPTSAAPIVTTRDIPTAAATTTETLPRSLPRRGSHVIRTPAGRWWKSSCPRSHRRANRRTAPAPKPGSGWTRSPVRPERPHG